MVALVDVIINLQIRKKNSSFNDGPDAALEGALCGDGGLNVAL